MRQLYSKIAKHLKANPVKQKSTVKCIYSPQLTYKLYCLLEVGADVGHVAVFHRDPLVVIVALGRLQVPAWHVEQGCDVKVAEIILSGGMVGTTEVEERQDLYWFTLRKEKREKAETWVKLTTHSFDRQHLSICYDTTIVQAGTSKHLPADHYIHLQTKWTQDARGIPRYWKSP